MLVDMLLILPPSFTYSSIIARDSVCLTFLIAALNDLDILSANVGNACLNNPMKECVYTICGIEVGNNNFDHGDEWPEAEAAAAELGSKHNLTLFHVRGISTRISSTVKLRVLHQREQMACSEQIASAIEIHSYIPTIENKQTKEI